MAAKTSWRIYGTQLRLRHCHPIYRKMLCNYYIRIVVIFLLSKILITTAFSGRCSDGPVAGSVPDFIGVV